jgi:hypothetical protein
MQNFMDSQVPITETREALQSLVSNSSVPLTKLHSKIASFLAMPMTTQRECDEASSQLSTALDAPVMKFPAGHPNLNEMTKFNEDLKVSVRPNRKFDQMLNL